MAPADAAPALRMTASEYLAWEREQPERHEYLSGDVFAMAGGTPRHNALVGALTVELGVAVRGGTCRVMPADQRIVARDREHYVYADASLVCGPMELAEGTRDVLANPSVVVEVLSKSKEAYDRTAKWDSYQSIRSLDDYLLVRQDTVRIEHFARNKAGGWILKQHGPGDRVTLTNGAVLEVDAIYVGVFELEGD